MRTATGVAPLIDASIGAKPAPTIEEVEQFVGQTVPFGFAVTLAEPYYIKRAAEILHPAGRKVCTVLSYPLAGMTRESKLFQIERALCDGADELDVSMNLSAFLSGREEETRDEMAECFALEMCIRDRSLYPRIPSYSSTSLATREGVRVLPVWGCLLYTSMAKMVSTTARMV